MECCLVDNNSQPPLKELDYVQSFLAKTSWAKLIIETVQGISSARRAGANATSALVVIYLDDDNQPDPNYVTNLVVLLRQYPRVGIWGPGRVQVEFMDEVAPWVHYNKWIHQERSTEAVAFGQEPHWTTHHPAGTGHVVRRDVMKHYQNLVDANKVTLTGRMGKSLASGEDAQIVYTAIKHGYYVGMSPTLAIRHLIPKKRTHIAYVKKLLYSIMSSGAVANVEIFPDQKDHYFDNIRSSRKIIVSLLRIVGASLRDRSLTQFQMHSGSYLGTLAGSYEAVSGKLPYWLMLSVRLLKLQ